MSYQPVIIKGRDYEDGNSLGCWLRGEGSPRSMYLAHLYEEEEYDEYPLKFTFEVNTDTPIHAEKELEMVRI